MRTLCRFIVTHAGLQLRLLLLLLLLITCRPLHSQELPRAEIFGGYQFAHSDPAFNGNGWNASLAGNFNRWFGVAADFSGIYKNEARLHTYMFGPVFSARSERVTPFAHALFGGATSSGSNAFTMALGGGLDINASQRVAVRAIQMDWLALRSEGRWFRRNARVSTGLVVRF